MQASKWVSSSKTTIIAGRHFSLTRAPIPRTRSGARRIWRQTAGLALAVLLLPGCTLMPRSNSKPKVEVRTVKEARQSLLEGKMTVPELQSLLMGYADDFSLGIMHAATTLEEEAKTPEERVQVRRWKLSHCNGATILAAGPNPVISLLDLTGMATLGRMAWEEDWMPKTFGARGQAMLEVHRRYEKEIWEITDRVLNPEHRVQLREIIKEWHDTHPEERFAAFVALCDYAKRRLQAPESLRASSGSFLSLVYLDPMAGLDPATQQLEQTRHLAERMLYYAQRAPGLLRLQGELLGTDLLASPEIKKFSSEVTQFRETAQRFTDVTEHLPERIGREQKELIDDVLKEQDRLNVTLKQLQETFRGGAAMAESVKEATQALDALTARVISTNAATSNTNSHLFDIRDYGRSAEQIERAAAQLTTTIQSLERLAASPSWKEHGEEIQAAFTKTESATQRLIERIFWRALALVVVIFVAAFFYRLAVRQLRSSSRELETVTKPEL